MPFTILLVDDDKHFREIFRYYLNDYIIIEASYGRDALNILKKPHLIDLIVLDQMLPDVRGTELLHQMKQLAPETSIIILTGHSSKEVAIDALRGHADDYMEKPIDVNRIKNLIQKILDNKIFGDESLGNDVPGKVELAKSYIERNSQKMVSLKEVAQALCLSPKYLSRIFKESTGKNFTHFRLEVKMEMAKNLLKATDYNISQVADKLGYENPESFIRGFKKVTSLTPTEYRKTTDDPSGQFHI
ncbi:MAG: response regulator transcription factor [Candidatus Auribacterota bacterium]